MPRGVKLVADQYLEIVAVVPGTKSVMRREKLSSEQILSLYGVLSRQMAKAEFHGNEREPLSSGENQGSGQESQGTVSGTSDVSQSPQNGDSNSGRGSNVSGKDHGGKSKG